MNSALQTCTATGMVATVLLLGAGSVAADDLSLSANTPEVSVSTRTSSRNFMPLPALEYEVTVEHLCSAGTRPGRISLSVADTRVALSDISEPGSRTINLSIPEDQIPPVRVEEFCLADAPDADGESRISIPAVLSVQGSLVCENDEGSRIVYGSTPLDIIVTCEREPDAPAESGDQDPQ